MEPIPFRIYVLSSTTSVSIDLPPFNSILLQLWGAIMQPALTSCTFALFKQSGGENDVRGKKKDISEGKRKSSEQFCRKAARQKNELCEWVKVDVQNIHWICAAFVRKYSC